MPNWIEFVMPVPLDRNCSICGRQLIASFTAVDPDDPRINCGGDCWGCIREIEAPGYFDTAESGQEADQ